jgi:hypothetical protein
LIRLILTQIGVRRERKGNERGTARSKRPIQNGLEEALQKGCHLQWTAAAGR